MKEEYRSQKIEEKIFLAKFAKKKRSFKETE